MEDNSPKTPTANPSADIIQPISTDFNRKLPFHASWASGLLDFSLGADSSAPIVWLDPRAPKYSFKANAE